MSIQPPKDKAERDARLDLVLSDIESNPDHWNQAKWHCNTSHCFAGFAQLRALGLSVKYPLVDLGGNGRLALIEGEERLAPADAATWLGLPREAPSERHSRIWSYVWCCPALFVAVNTLAALRRIVSEIKATDYTPPAALEPEGSH